MVWVDRLRKSKLSHIELLGINDNENRNWEIHCESVSKKLNSVPSWYTSAATDVFFTQKRCVAGVSQKTTFRHYFRHFEKLNLPSIIVFELATAVFVRKKSFVKNWDDNRYNERNRPNFFESNFHFRISRQQLFLLKLMVLKWLTDDIRHSKNIFVFKNEFFI